jgi:uncharacterized repeat protein (TIGR01451 family)
MLASTAMLSLTVAGTNAAPAAATPVPPALGSAIVSLGQSGPSSTAAKVDVLLQLLSNGSPIASGIDRCVSVAQNTSSAITYTRVSARMLSDGTSAGSSLDFRASVRIGTNADGTRCSGASSSLPGVRVYYDSKSKDSHLANLQINPSSAPATYYLHSDGTSCTLSTPTSGVSNSWFDPYAATATAKNVKCQTSGSLNYRSNNPWVAMGTFHLAQPSLTVAVTSPQASFNALDQGLRYSYLVTNTGNVTLNSITIDDPLPGLIGLSCPSSVLAPGATETCTSVYLTDQADLDHGSVANSATALGTAPGASSPTVSSPSSVTVPAVQSPALTVVKSATETSFNAAGQTLNYDYLVTNTGNVTLSSIGINDNLSGLTGLSCPVASLAPGANETCTASYSTTQADVDHGSVANSATAQGTAPGASSPTVSSPSSVKVQADQNPAIGVVKSASVSSFDAPGIDIGYSYVVTNLGNVTLSSVNVTDSMLPTVTCPDPSLAPGASETCTAGYTTTQADVDAGSISNTATASGTAPSAAVVTEQASLSVPGLQSPALTVAKSATESSFNGVGQTLNFNYLVTNTGNVTLSSIGINDNLSGLMGLNCPVASLAPGANETCTATYTVSQADVDNGSVANTATAQGTAPEASSPTVSDPSSVTVPAVQNPSLSLSSSVTESDFSAVGQLLHFSYLVTNTGNVTLALIGINDDHTSGLSGMNCPDASLAPGANETCAATYTTTASDMGDGQVNNNATAQGTAPGATTPTVSGSSNVTVPTIAAPAPEPISVSELQLPPVSTSNAAGACTTAINPNGTGCIGVTGGVGMGGFMPDNTEVVATVNFVGAPAAPNPSSIYSGSQVILVKTNGTTFDNGDPWKCVTCGIPAANKLSLDASANYFRAFPDGERILLGDNVIDCGPNLLASDACTPAVTHEYPLYFDGTTNGANSSIREVVLDPDGVHVGFDMLYTNANGIQEVDFYGKLVFDPAPTTGTPLVPRYDIDNVNLMLVPGAGSNAVSFTVSPSNPSQLNWNPNAITVGEIRGFSGDGESITYIGTPTQSDNTDVYSANLTTGVVTDLTRGQQYVDPMDEAPNNWSVDLGVISSGRMQFTSAMQGIPPLTDLVTAAAVSSIRNNGGRRFFQPALIDPYGGRGSYSGQIVNACTTGPCSTLATGPGNSASDPNWNAEADPVFSPDGTQIAYGDNLTGSPACGGSNPLPCETTTEPGGRTYRLMLAQLTSRTPIPAAQQTPATPSPDTVPWAQPYTPGESTTAFARPFPPAGTYTLNGLVSGSAQVTITDNATGVTAASATYTNYSNDGDHVINGSESVQAIFGRPGQNSFTSITDWVYNITETGTSTGTKVTTPGGPSSPFPAGFELTINVLSNQFQATGALMTTLNGQTYTQPANGQ